MKINFRLCGLMLLGLGLSTVRTENQTFAANSSTTGNGPLGLGIMFGEPTGLNLKYWTNSVNALNFGLTYSFGNYMVIMGDYLWHFPHAFPSSKHGRAINTFIPYVGIGGVFFTQNATYYNNSVALGARVPVGIEFLPHQPSLGVFLEVAPGITIAPSVRGFLQGYIGIRYYF